MSDRIAHAAVIEGSGQSATIYEVTERVDAGHRQNPRATIPGLKHWEDEVGNRLFKTGEGRFESSDGRVYLIPKAR